MVVLLLELLRDYVCVIFWWVLLEKTTIALVNVVETSCDTTTMLFKSVMPECVFVQIVHIHTTINMYV